MRAAPALRLLEDFLEPFMTNNGDTFLFPSLTNNGDTFPFPFCLLVRGKGKCHRFT